MERISDDKLKHIRGVAELMYERAFESTGSTEYAEDMYLLGFVHDFGYFAGKSFHEVNGGNILRRNGYRYSDEVAEHGNHDAVIDTDELVLLKWCDMSVGPHGEPMSVNERVEDIGNRYGFDSQTYIDCCELRDELARMGMF